MPLALILAVLNVLLGGVGILSASSTDPDELLSRIRLLPQVMTPCRFNE